MMDSNEESFTIREIRNDECGQLMDMIYELADHLGEREEITNTEEGLRQDLFGDTKRCYCLVAEHQENGLATGRLVGYSVYFYAYHTWTGTTMHMEDLFVRDAYRRKGIGTRLYRAVVQIALDSNSHKLELTVLMSNKKAYSFYKSLGMVDQTLIDGRHKMRLGKKQMEYLVLSEEQ